MLRNLILTGAWLVGGALLQTACDLVESHYPSMADAKHDGAFDRGWLPSFLPERSRNIREIHYIDTGETWCAFDFPADEATVLREALTPVKPGEVSSMRVRRPGVSWWPEVLEGRLDSEEVQRAGLELYESGSIFFAVDWLSGRAFFYRESA